MADDWDFAEHGEVGIWGYLDGKGDLKEGIALYNPRLWQVLTVLESDLDKGEGALGWRVPRARVEFTGDVNGVIQFLRSGDAYSMRVAANFLAAHSSPFARAVDERHSRHHGAPDHLRTRHSSLEVFTPWLACPVGKRYERRFAYVDGATGYLECEKWTWETNYLDGLFGLKAPTSRSTEVLIDAWEEVDLQDGTFKFPRCWVLNWSGPRA
ncbi:MAG: hypothetical protein AAF250_15320 [Pseudomonadota bacterium]